MMSVAAHVGDDVVAGAARAALSLPKAALDAVVAAVAIERCRRRTTRGDENVVASGAAENDTVFSRCNGDSSNPGRRVSGIIADHQRRDFYGDADRRRSDSACPPGRVA